MGALRATGDQTQLKTSRNFISGHVSPPRDILGGIEVEISLNSLMYTSFTSPLIKVLQQRYSEGGGANHALAPPLQI